MLTTQEFYDKTISHLMRQGRARTADEYGEHCLYRGPGGVSCAVGVHIPDKMYHKDMERKTIEAVSIYFPRVLKVIPDLSLATSLQSLHDDYSYWTDNRLNELGEMKTLRIAEIYNLTPYMGEWE